MQGNRDHNDTPPVPDFSSTEFPAGVDRRAFMMRSALIGAAP